MKRSRTCTQSLLIESIERRTLLSAGQADPTFGDGGSVLAGSYPDFNMTAIAVQADGKVLAAGNTEPENTHVAVLRFNVDGSPDTTFGQSGRMTFDYGGKNAFVNQMLEQANGRILMVGNTRKQNGQDDMAAARLMPDGTLDTSFSNDGKITFDVAGGDEFLSQVMIAGSKIFVAGTTFDSTSQDFFIARLNDNGSFDTTFHTTGQRTIDFGGLDDTLGTLVISSDGKISLVGRSIGYALRSSLTRINADGSLDSTFSGDGRNTDSPLQARGVFVRSGARLLVFGDDQTHVQLRLYNSDGGVNKNFGTNGRINVELPGVATLDDVVEQVDGKFILTGSVTENQKLSPFVVRVNGSGAIDQTFIPPGLVNVSMPINGATTRVALASDQRVVVSVNQSHNTTPSSGESQLFRLANDNTPTIAAGVLTIPGTVGADTIVLSQNVDAGKLDVSNNGVVSTFDLEGLIQIEIDAGAGNDAITSVALNGFKPAIVIQAEDGNDTITGSSAAEVLDGGSGDDVIHGAGGADSINGEDGNDQLFGEKGEDSIIGSNGNDQLFGGPGNDSLFGGAGADEFNGNAGIDLASYEFQPASLTLSLDDHNNDGAPREHDNIHTDVENIYGGAGRDRITGDADANFLYGASGNDTIFGGGGNDTLKGGQTHDRLFGEAGDDLLLSRDTYSDSLDGGAGTDTAITDANPLDSLLNVEAIL